MPEDAAAYMQRNAIKPTFAEVLDAVCKEMPEPASLPAFMLTQFCEKFPGVSFSDLFLKLFLETHQTQFFLFDTFF